MLVTIFVIVKLCILFAVISFVADTGNDSFARADNEFIKSSPQTADSDTLNIFEGTLHYTLEINGTDLALRYYMRHGLVRIELDDPQLGGTMTMIAAPEENRMVVLIHEFQSYTELTLDDITGRSDYLLKQVNKLTRTGGKMVIGGITNDEYVIKTDKGETLQIWSPGKTTRYGVFQFPGFIDRILSDMLKNNLPKELFPFSISYQGNRSVVNLTLVSIREEMLAAELFTVPANYRKHFVTVPGH